MADSIGKRLIHGWNAFQEAFSRRNKSSYYTGWSGANPGRQRLRVQSERQSLAAIFTRMAIDFASIELRHCTIGSNREYLEDVESYLNDALTLDTNLDQSARAFKQDLAMTLFERGHAVVVPVDTTLNPSLGSFDTKSLRVGWVVSWEAKSVWVSLYNEAKGQREEINLEKAFVAIIENPFYDVMNEPNSTLQRLTRKLHLLDVIDEQIGSGKLDLIIQLPYIIKNQAKQEQADKRRQSIEEQLKGSQYGIAYTDATERITQLNRPVENNLLAQVEWLTNKVYEELGTSVEILSGTADEQTLLNYFNRTIEPLSTAVTEEFSRKFLTRNARTRGQRIKAIRDPFKLVPVNNIAEIADKFTRNEIFTSNEMRGFIGVPPSKDPKADELRNANIAAPKEEANSSAPVEDEPEKKVNQNGS